MADQVYGTQSDAFQAEHDLHRRSAGKERKLSLREKHVGEHGGHNSADDLLEVRNSSREIILKHLLIGAPGHGIQE